MKEEFLHFLWQFQQFDKQLLQTTEGVPLQVIQIGRLNRDAGPDFLDARLLIGNLEWVGSVEVHLRSSDWNTHTHQSDAAYGNVILHLVWEHDKEILRHDHTQIPTLSLKKIANLSLLSTYQQLLESKSMIPCKGAFEEVDSLKKVMMLDKALMKRFEQKGSQILVRFRENQEDWEETAYQTIAQNFGFKINADPFLSLAQRLPLKVLQKHRNSLLQIEAMVFGVAGFLEQDSPDEYHANLKQEYAFLAAKYQLKTKQLGLHEWKFLRLRPANFPTIRLAQFAKLVQENANLFSLFFNLENLESFAQLLRLNPSDYWQKHYVFGKEVAGKVAIMGATSVENIVINTVVPLMVAQAIYRDNHEHTERAIQLLEKIAPESNTIVDDWKTMGLKIKNAFDSQASIEWYKHYCMPKKCLQCDVGLAIIRGRK